MPFTLTTQQCKITSANPIGEQHGPNVVMAFSIKLATVIDAAALEPLMEGISGLLFKRPPKSSASASLPGVEPAAEAPAVKQVRFPLLDTLSLKRELTGYRVLITWGDLASSTKIVLVDVNASKFSVDPKEGGSVEVAFTLVSHPDSRYAGELCALLKHDINLSMWPMSDADGEEACNAALATSSVGD